MESLGVSCLPVPTSHPKACFRMNNKSNSVENKISTSEELPTNSTQQQTEYQRTSSAPDTGFPMNPFDFSSIQDLVNIYLWAQDPTIKDMAEQISKNPVVSQMIEDMADQIAEDPVFSQMAEQISKHPVVSQMIKDMAEQFAEDPEFSQMAEQCQKSVPSTEQDIVPPLDPQQFISTMQQVRENPKFMKMAEHLRNAIMQDPVLSSMIVSKEQIEEQMARVKENPALKGVLEAEEEGVYEEDESIVHQTASVGDVEI